MTDNDNNGKRASPPPHVQVMVSLFSEQVEDIQKVNGLLNVMHQIGVITQQQLDSCSLVCNEQVAVMGRWLLRNEAAEGERMRKLLDIMNATEARIEQLRASIVANT